MGMACSSEVRAAAAIAEDVGFDSLPCPQFSDSFLIWCPHHSWVSNNHSKTSQKLTGLLGLLFTVYDSCRYQGCRGWRILDKTTQLLNWYMFLRVSLVALQGDDLPSKIGNYPGRLSILIGGAYADWVINQKCKYSWYIIAWNSH